MTLLWRHMAPPRGGIRGPKPKVSVDTVVATAIAVADRDGYERVSMRTVAAELGLRPMSLYTYVPSKEALTVLMVDAVAETDAPIDPSASPRRRMGAIARGVRDEYLAHPWLLEVSPWRLVLGPGRIRRYERQLAAVDGIGLSDLDMDRVIATLTDFATGNARMAIAAIRETRALSDQRWWEEHGPLLDELMPESEFPLAARVGATVGEHYQAPGDPDDAFEYGLARLLDGIFADPAGPRR
ncbi:TetR/AcrR family transcriptional regulator [Nocardia bovistercoris]|uniref:TetR/AcrR family transcriptional regulator C-terminal domain-containing protein n=1 Tax=Nocardia bovistercoris TaxID=2785916 RepID=A0A931N1N4_9NOCA|nr:TetR/AcrR family transcriptional regulator [Nocardia bovistercoris]MBH0775116.1 TetR/AcrR family transcriptional regulator C-terminal domain-containing protein [Nocardia bovistercoris]